MRSVLTVSGALTMFATYLVAGGRSAGTVKLRRYYLERLHRFAQRHLFDLRTPDLLTFVGQPDWSPETRKSVRTSVFTFYAWAHEAGYLPDNPARGLPTVPVPTGVAKPTPDEVVARALREARTDRDRLILLLAAYAGLRRSEVARVMPRDFTAAGLWVRGKGGRERVVPVHPVLSAALLDELERRAVGEVGTGWRYRLGVSVDGPLFPAQNGSGTCHPDVIGKRLKLLLGPGWTGHTLRHRFATKSYEAERDLLAVQELLGHSKPETTRRYVQVPSRAKVRAVANVGLTVVA